MFNMNETYTTRASFVYQIAVIGLLFFIFGFVTWLNGTLIPFLQLVCQLDTQQALLVTFAFYISYFFLALPSSEILKRIGMKKGMAAGLVVMAAGCLIFISATQGRSFPWFLTGLFVQGMGLSLLQTASNPYVSIIGPIESAAVRISLMGICNKLAGIISPIALSALVLQNAGALEQELAGISDLAAKSARLDAVAARLIVPYVVMAAVLGALALMIWFSRLPEIDLTSGDGQAEGDTPLSAGKTSIWQFPHAWLGALGIFFYVGVEVMAGDTIGPYGKLLGFSLDQTKYFTSFTLGGMLVGYVLGILLIPKYISQQAFLRYSAIAGIALTLSTYFLQGEAAIMSIALLGLANAVMWPAIFPLAIRGLGRFTQTGSALLIMGIAGGAVLPQVFGFLQKSIDFRLAYQMVMIPGYLFILYYAVRGYKPK